MHARTHTSHTHTIHNTCTTKQDIQVTNKTERRKDEQDCTVRSSWWCRLLSALVLMLIQKKKKVERDIFITMMRNVFEYCFPNFV